MKNQVKVNEIKILENPKDSYKVSKGKLVLLKEDRKAIVGEIIEKRGGIFLFNNDRKHFHIASEHEVYMQGAQKHPELFTVNKPIIISETDNININEWAYNTKTGEVRQLTHGKEGLLSDGMYWCKILAFTEHFSYKHLQAIIDFKIKDGDYVYIECEIKAFNEANKEIDYALDKKDFTVTYIKMNNEHVTLFPVEETWDNVFEEWRKQDVMLNVTTLKEFLKTNYYTPKQIKI